MLHLVVRHPSGVQREGQEGYVLQPLPRQFWNNNITRISQQLAAVFIKEVTIESSPLEHLDELFHHGVPKDGRVDNERFIFRVIERPDESDGLLISNDDWDHIDLEAPVDLRR